MPPSVLMWGITKDASGSRRHYLEKRSAICILSARQHRDQMHSCDRLPALGAMVSRSVSGVLSSASRRLGDHPSVRPTSGCCFFRNN